MPNTAETIGLSPPRARCPFSGRALGLGALLVAVTLAVYLQVGRFGFIPIDDRLYVTEEPHIHHGLTPSGIAWAFGAFYDCNWIPLTWISLMAEATLYGKSPGGHHLANLLLHAANVLLVFALFSKATGERGRSAFVAALFAVHPLHVESVAWIAERKDVLSLFFGLLALNAYVGHARKPHAARYGLALGFYLCSLLSKQTLVTLPCVLLLLDSWPLGRWRRVGRLVAEKLPFFALSAVFCGVELLAQVRGHSTRSLAEIPLATRCQNAVLVYALYLKKAVWPFDLAAFYPHPGPALSRVAVATAFVLLATVTGLAIANRRRWPFLLVGWLWYLGALIPMIGVVQVGIQQMADRYTYFPMLGLYAAVAWLVPTLVGERARNYNASRRVDPGGLQPGLGRAQPIRGVNPPARRPDGAAGIRALRLAAVAVVALYATVAFVQVGYWRDGVTLMRRTLAVTPDNSFARFSLGDALYVDSRIDEAIEEFRHAVRLAPDDPEGYFRLGWVYQGLKQYDEAAKQFRASLAVDETIAPTHNRLGWILWAERQYAAAEREFHRALELDPRNVEAHVNLAGLARTLGDYAQSIAYCRQALAIDPGLIDYQRLIAFNLRDQGRLDEAVAQLEGVLAAAPGDQEARSELDHVLSMRADRPQLVRQ